MFLQALQSVVALFRTNKDDSKAQLDGAFAEHAAAIQDADRACQIARGEADARLWEAIKSHLDLRGRDADEVSAKAGEFQRYAEMVDADHQRMRQLSQEFAAKIDPPPEVPAGDIQVKFEPVELVAEAPAEHPAAAESK